MISYRQSDFQDYMEDGRVRDNNLRTYLNMVWHKVPNGNFNIRFGPFAYSGSSFAYAKPTKASLRDMSEYVNNYEESIANLYFPEEEAIRRMSKLSTDLQHKFGLVAPTGADDIGGDNHLNPTYLGNGIFEEMDDAGYPSRERRSFRLILHVP